MNIARTDRCFIGTCVFLDVLSQWPPALEKSKICWTIVVMLSTYLSEIVIYASKAFIGKFISEWRRWRIGITNFSDVTSERKLLQHNYNQYESRNNLLVLCWKKTILIWEKKWNLSWNKIKCSTINNNHILTCILSH